MIKEAMEWIAIHTTPNYLDHAGRKFSDKALVEIIANPYSPAPLEFKSLASFVDFVNNSDVAGKSTKNFVTASDWNKLDAYVPWGGDSNKRIQIAKVSYDFSAKFEPGRWYEQGDFVSLVLTMFTDNEERTRLLNIAKKIVSERSLAGEDDGISQKVTVSAGIKRLAEEKITNPFHLRLFRTWPEVDQPESPFVFRIQEKSGQLAMSLFDFGGDLWKVYALNNAMAYLKENINSAKALVY